jgi:AraC-like DNA-binding protein
MGFHTEQWVFDRPPLNKADSPIYTVHFVLDGVMHINIDSGAKKYTVPQDSVYVHFPNQNATLYADSGDPCAVAWITLDGLKVHQYMERVGITKKEPVLYLSKDEKLRALFMDAPKQIRENRLTSDFLALEYFYAILGRMSAQTAHIQLNMIANVKERHVASAINYINGNFQNSLLSLNDVAESVGLSPVYLSVIFTQITGNSFTNYVFNKRLTAALSLIDDGNTNVADIAYKCGFNCQFYFSKQFKKYNLISPKTLIMSRIRAQNEANGKSPPAAPST